jgi:hypothetical protein
MVTKQIGLYPDAFTVTGAQQITVDNFIDKIREGEWQDEVLHYRSLLEQNKIKAAESAKKKLPLVTASGTFKTRSISGLEKHSGFIAIDIDYGTLRDRNIATIKEELSQDSLFYALFYSCSGGGICGFVKINPKAHQESFLYLSEHLYTRYGLNIDEKCKDVSRARFVSYDPDIYVNRDSQLSPITPLPKKERTKAPKYYHNDADFNRILDDIAEQQVDLTVDYNDWIKCGFALVDAFGENGREYFHKVSENNADYDYDKADAKYDHLLKSKEGDITIDWFYYVIEKHGLKAYGKATQEFLQETIAEQRAYDMGLIDREPLEAAHISSLQIESGDTAIQIKRFIHKAYKIVRNEMTGAIEVNNETLDDEMLNTIYIMCRSVIDKIGSREIVYQVMDSRFTPRIHPFKDFIAVYEKAGVAQATGYIDQLVDTIGTDSPNAGLYIKKWLVSMVASVHGIHSPLMLILQGPQNCGKTQFFRRLLPGELSSYYAESKMDEGKDDKILMSKKMIILDDEMSGKSKQEQGKLKSTLSQQQMDLRVPFGRSASTLLRIAMLCGTANDQELINDPTGNRRLLVIGIQSINYEAYNAIDKGMLMYEAYLEYKNGYNYEMTKEEIEILSRDSENFKQSVPEEELLAKYYELPEESKGSPVHRTCSEICMRLKEQSRMQVNPFTLGKYLKKMGFVQRTKKTGKTTIRQYCVVEISDFEEEIYVDDIL